MSLIMTQQTENYAINDSPTQSSMGFMNGYPASHHPYNSTSNQWQQIKKSPNGSPVMMPYSNVPAVPSPLLNSMSNRMGGTPQQSNSIKTPGSVQQLSSQTLRSPFEEDLDNLKRPASRQQMPPPMAPPTFSNPRLFFDMIKEFRSQMYCKGNDQMLRCRLPLAYNTVGSERIPYPTMNLNRSPSFQQNLMPPPQMPMPVTSSAPSSSTKRRPTKKQKELQLQQEQMQSSQMNGMPNFPHGISPVAMDLNRPCSSHDLNGYDPNMARNSPNSYPLNMKMVGRSPSTDAFMQPRNMRLMPNEKIATEGYPCALCRNCITNEKRGIRCTAMNQGCLNSFHIECAGLSFDAYNHLIKDPRCEWVCQMCQKSKPILFHT